MKNTKVDEQSEMLDTSTELTPVRVRFTEVKFFNATTEQIDTQRTIGKITMPEARSALKAINPEHILIEKKNVYESFEVNTVALYQLKEGK